MFKVKIESEIQKTKKENVDKGNQLVEQTNQLLLQQSTEETEVIKHLGINKSILESVHKRKETHLERKELESKSGDNIFTIKEIESMCIKYRLKFLPTSDYVGAIPPDLGARIVELKKKHNLNINDSRNSDSGNFFIMAPPSCFQLKDAESLKINLKRDPVMFYRISDGLYIMVHKWGKDFTYMRRWIGIMMESSGRVEIFRLVLFLSSFYLLFMFIYSIGNESMKMHEGDAFFVLLFAIATVGIITSFRQSILATSDEAGSKEGWDMNVKSWRKVKVNL